LITFDPKRVDMEKPYLYFDEIQVPAETYRYVGKATSARRVRAYSRNVKRIFKGLPRRITPGQEPYRYVHLILAIAVKMDWPIKFYALENVEPEKLNQIERQRKEDSNSLQKPIYAVVSPNR
jgi:hypothetical protein